MQLEGSILVGGGALSADEVISTWVLVSAKSMALLDPQVLSRPHLQSVRFQPEWVISRDSMSFYLEKE